MQSHMFADHNSSDGMYSCSVGFSFFVFSTVLCADRVGQMTKTYNDIDAVTRLLEEVRYFNFASSLRVN